MDTEGDYISGGPSEVLQLFIGCEPVHPFFSLGKSGPVVVGLKVPVRVVCTWTIKLGYANDRIYF